MAKRKTTKRSSKQEADRKRRLAWWREARFGMFIHWGLYAQLGRHEWAMNRECIPWAEYDKLADDWNPKPNAPREWAKLAKKAGMKYMVLTTKHHEGFCLWDTEQTDFNAVKRGPGRDLVAEYVDAARRYDMGVGLYYSLMDWRHPDGLRCDKSEPARRRFLDYTQGCVRELMSNYGKIDILWYDVPSPLRTPEEWESKKMNAMARKLQPDLLINNRSCLPEDFGTPEERIKAEEGGRAWEACMTFNGSWGYLPSTKDEDWHSARGVVKMLRTCANGGGNLLLNIGPKPDGTVPERAVERLTALGKWTNKNAEAIYGETDPTGNWWWDNLGPFTRKGRNVYYFVERWAAGNIVLGGYQTKLKRASFLHNDRELDFEQDRHRIVFKDMPVREPERSVGITVIKLEFASTPKRPLGADYPCPRK